MQLANRVTSLKPSATLSVNALAQELISSGKDVISLSLGEPDFNTPDYIGKKAIEAIESGFTKYTAVSGIIDLRRAVAEYFNTNYSAGAEATNILIGNGGKQCLFNILLAVLNPGDEVLIPAPYWVSYPPMVEIAGGIPVVVPSGASKGFKVTPEDLERLRTERTKICIINSPSNPTGVVYKQEELDAIAEWAVHSKVLVISDEIYDRLVYDNFDFYSLSSWWKRYPEYFTIVNGMAKSFAMTGWRVGYMLAHPALIKAVDSLQGQSTSNICSISQKAALAALVELEDNTQVLDEMYCAFARRRNLVMEVISSWPDVLCPEPGGAFYVFPDLHLHYRPGLGNSTEMCRFLLQEAGVALVPGDAFGDDNCVRISYALNDDVLKVALERISVALFK